MHTVVVVMLENRSFDHYFGTFPGARGFPRNEAGQIAVCIPDPVLGRCSRPEVGSVEIRGRYISMWGFGSRSFPTAMTCGWRVWRDAPTVIRGSSSLSPT
jgi:hypothetical protein